MRAKRFRSREPYSGAFLKDGVRLLTGALLLATSCVGEITEGPLEYEPPSARGSQRSDAGSADGDASSRPRPQRPADAGRRDAGPSRPNDEDAGIPASPRPPEGPEAGVTAPGDACGKTRDASLALGLRIREVALYQAVRVSLYNEGAWVPRAEVPIVQGKRALVRVFVDPLPGYVAHAVRATLRLQNGAELTELRSERSLVASSSEQEMTSTFTFDVPGNALGEATELSVQLDELRCGERTGAAEDARAPSSGMQPLSALAIRKLRVMVVPVSVNGRLPVTTERELANMRAALLAYYPVPDVELAVHKPLAWSSPVGALDADNWSDLLTEIQALRRTEAVEDDVYYFGLIQPAATYLAYCQRSCMLGLAPQTVRVAPNYQVALGASFADEQTYETMVHELAHAHGRGHAPCVKGGEIAGVDPAYPDPEGGIGGWGWDSRTSALMPPTMKDIMGYCQPNWISSYTFSALAQRSSEVNTKALLRNQSEAVRWHHVLLYPSGRARWGGAVETSLPPGALEQADVLGRDGRVLEQIEVVRIPLSHSGGEYLYVPEPGPAWAAIALQDRTLSLAEIAPAR